MRWYKTAMEQPATREKVIQEVLDRFARDNQGLRQKMSRFMESNEEAASIIEAGGDVSSRLGSLYSVSNVVPVGTWVKPTGMHPEWARATWPSSERTSSRLRGKEASRPGKRGYNLRFGMFHAPSRSLL